MPPIEGAEKVVAAAIELTEDTVGRGKLAEKFSAVLGWFGRKPATAEAADAVSDMAFKPASIRKFRRRPSTPKSQHLSHN